MRYGVLSDVHANAAALRTAVGRLRAAGVDGWLCAGDIVGYGPHPNECVDLLAGIGARCVAGNHELMVLGTLETQRAGRLARETTPWTRSVLRDDCRAFLAGLPTVLRLPGLVMAHGSLTDVETYVTRAPQAAQELEKLRRREAGAGVLVLGHTHRQWLFDPAGGTLAAPAGPEWPFPETGPFLVNPGSVGQSRQRERAPRARFLLLDMERRRLRFFAEPYDAAATLAALRRHGLPRSCVHVPPGRLRAVPRRVATLLRHARR